MELVVIPKDDLRQMIGEIVEYQVDSTFKQYKEMLVPEDKMMTIQETARFLDVSKVTLHNWKKNGKLPYLRLGKRVFFSQKEILEAMKSNVYLRSARRSTWQ
ncbi:helix-turn-helix domain-containing protein [Bacteroidota bacterium]